jgi:hypothetical protein
MLSVFIQDVKLLKTFTHIKCAFLIKYKIKYRRMMV